MRKSALLAFGLVVTALVLLGLVVLSSASQVNATRYHGGDAYFFMRRQFEYLAVGVVLAVVVAISDYRRWRDVPWLAWAFYAVVLVLLVVVFKFKAINGAHRWINLGPVRLQPSEFAKLAVVIVVAVWQDRAGYRVELFRRGAFWPAVMIGILAVPILLEPDFGSVMVVGLAGFLVMFVAGTRFLHLLPFFLAGVGVVAYRVLMNPNRMARIAAFLGIKINVGAEVVDAAAERAAYQVNMALAAIGNGGLWGVGLGESMQKQWYLPEAHTDFVFAIGAEELGIVFSVGVVLLFVAFFALSVYIARKASDRFGRFLVIGMAFIIFFQAMFNIGVVCKALPTKGMALPFFSYGGTNLLSAFFAVGTILSVGIHSYRDRKHMLARKVLMRAS
ncbi:MAG: cell division protein FtsW [Kiritimatiellae bacterium]|nr:cell division protein FtsW [Kiritimatiellia bacterium]